MNGSWVGSGVIHVRHTSLPFFASKADSWPRIGLSPPVGAEGPRPSLPCSMSVVYGSDADFVEVPEVPRPAPATCDVHTGAPVFAFSATTELSCWPVKSRLSLVSYANPRAMIWSVVAFGPDEV